MSKEDLTEPMLIKAMSKVFSDLSLVTTPILDLVDKPHLVKDVAVMCSTFKVIQ